jgi:hypothetical protein
MTFDSHVGVGNANGGQIRRTSPSGVGACPCDRPGWKRMSFPGPGRSQGPLTPTNYGNSKKCMPQNSCNTPNVVGTRFYRVRDLSIWDYQSINCGRGRTGSLRLFLHFLRFDAAIWEPSQFVGVNSRKDTPLREARSFYTIGVYDACVPADRPIKWR